MSPTCSATASAGLDLVERRIVKRIYSRLVFVNGRS
jgi:hypothetical protein